MTGYRLYGRDGTGSAAVEAALAEAGVAYTVTEVPGDAEAARAAGFFDVNPRGQVPALALPDGSIVTEGTAILLHLADAFPAAKLAPAPGTPARAQHDRWLMFLQANVYEGELRHFYSDRYTTDADGAAGVEAAAIAYVARHRAMFDKALGAAAGGTGPFFFGDRLSMLDIYAWNLSLWTDADALAAACPWLARLAAAVAARPAIAPIHARQLG